jgi:hypothetical protein
MLLLLVVVLAGDAGARVIVWQLLLLTTYCAKQHRSAAQVDRHASRVTCGPACRSGCKGDSGLK